MTKITKENEKCKEEVRFDGLALLATFSYCGNDFIKTGKSGIGAAIALGESRHITQFNETSLVIETDCEMNIKAK